MRTINSNSGRKWKNIFRSIDDIFIVIGILLNGFSLIYSFLSKSNSVMDLSPEHPSTHGVAVTEMLPCNFVQRELSFHYFRTK